MGCGCKKKKLSGTATQPRKARNIVIVEGQVRERPVRKPATVNPPPPPENNVENVVNKLNDILKP